MDKQIARMKELILILNKASKIYYQNNTSMMTDYEYDRLYDELVELEKKTQTTLSNSPTINVEPAISSSLQQVEHPSPMLSLSKTKEVDDLITFLDDKVGLLSWKLDGLTVVLTYEQGNLISGVTRGTGTVGEVVTANVKQFKNVPLTIPFKGRLVIRGEAVIKYSDFKIINEEIGDGSTQYKNPRNLCSGSVRQLDSKVTATRNVNYIVFALVEASEKISNLRSKGYDWLEAQGFEVIQHQAVNKNNLAESVQAFKEQIKTYDIPSDGLVLSYDDIVYGESLGRTAKFPKHSIAFKWQDETAETKLEAIDWNVSRTGLINPVAVFKAVDLEGTIVTRASLHNVSILRGLKLGIGDNILVYKANMIIPQVASNLTQSNSAKIPDKCPTCDQPTQIIDASDVQYLYCTNEFCPAKLMKKLSLFTSKQGMNIDGISDAILNRFIDEGIISKYSDLYNLEKYKEKIIAIDGFGEKSFNNLIKSIEKSRNVKLVNFIYALGIADIGLARAKLICNYFNNDLQRIINADYEALKNIMGIGEIIAAEWVKTFSNDIFLEEFNNLLKEIIFINQTNTTKKSLIDKTFVITGNVINFANRDELIEYIENAGGKVVKAISANVDYLINNDLNSTSTKNKKAQDLNIKVISETELLELTK